MNYSLDRIENDIAVLIDENEKKREISPSLLPNGVKQGDIFTEKNGEFLFNKEKTDAKKAAIAAKLKNILHKG